MQISTHSVFDTNNKQDVLGRTGVRRAQGVMALKTWWSEGVNCCGNCLLSRNAAEAMVNLLLCVLPVAGLLGPRLGRRRIRQQQCLLFSSTHHLSVIQQSVGCVMWQALFSSGFFPFPKGSQIQGVKSYCLQATCSPPSFSNLRIILHSCAYHISVLTQFDTQDPLNLEEMTVSWVWDKMLDLNHTNK